MFCDQCGKQVADDSVFCDGCGMKMNGTSQQETVSAVEPIVEVQQEYEPVNPIPVPVVAPVPVVVPVAVPAPAPAPAPQVQQQVSSGKDLKKPLGVFGYLVTFIVLGIPVLGQIMLFVWAFGKKGNINRKNMCIAELILFAIALICSIGLYIYFILVLGYTLSDMTDLMPVY